MAAPRWLGLRGPAGFVAARTGWSVGQAYTALLGFTVVVFLVGVGIPPVLRHGDFVIPRPLSFPSARRAAVAPVHQPAAPAFSATRVAASAPAPFADEGASVAVGSEVAPDVVSSAAPAYDDGGSFGTMVVLAHVPSPGSPEGVVSAPDGSFWVVTNDRAASGGGPSLILHFDASGHLARSYPVEGQQRGRTSGLTGVTLGPDGAVYALNVAPPIVIRLDPVTGRQVEYSHLPDLPSCVTAVALTGCEPSPVDHQPVPRGAAFDRSGRLLVTDGGQATVWRVPAGGGNPSIWHQSTDYAGDRGLAGVALDGAGSVVLSVTTSLLAVDGTGAVYLVHTKGDGGAGDRMQLAKTPAGGQPVGLAIGASGSVYVALQGANRVLVLAPNGTRRDELPHSSSPSEPRFDGPVGLAFRGQSLLVTNQSPSAHDPAAWTVMRLAVGETTVSVA
ncbi:MAG: hypothetical protein JWO37_3764 [Acidimicrobiales bacterium]|jgi:sugar lactone lactonase YvrE|nr:hypothetical protein [Acidimicrobiales bacterium]